MTDEDIITDALSLKLFGRNYNPHPSSAWFMMATEDEIAQWQQGDEEKEQMLWERMSVAKRVRHYTLEMAEEDEGLRHYVPDLGLELDPLRTRDIASFTQQKVRRSGRNFVTTCPFHNDTHPSCILYPDGRGYWCPACGAGGNAIDWAMQEFGHSFGQAVDYLNTWI